MSVVEITSDHVLSNIEEHFRVSAGPGAGKTHWLTEHIKNVVRNSQRLNNTRKVACITFTNIGVDTLLGRLGTSIEKVEVSTIHSFLYFHLVKPYISFIADEYEIEVSKVDGHDDIVLSGYQLLNDLKVRTGQQRIRSQNDNLLVEGLKSAKWVFGTAGNLELKTKYPIRIGGYSLKRETYFEYKKMAWAKGVVHHDDVLFFSYQLLTKHPFLVKVLRAKFPYFFIDEFQDSNPIQVEILNMIGQEETIIGIIGDKAQSIYGFQGADPLQFQSFSLIGIKDYVIRPNRRSTKKIIGLLNHIRNGDLVQTEYREEDGVDHILLVGSMENALREAKRICGDEEVFSLSRDNITSNAMKREMNGDGLNSKLLDELIEVDQSSSSNGYRSKFVSACIRAVELAREGKYKDSILTMEKEYKGIKDKTARKKVALKNITHLLSKYDSFKGESLYNFYQLIKSDIKTTLSNMRASAGKTFYEEKTYLQLAVCVKIPEDLSRHKTIHKAKGDEFKNVLVVLKEEQNLSFLTAPNLLATNDDGEEQRVYYVGASRAMERLFITVPELSEQNRNHLSSLFYIQNV